MEKRVLNSTGEKQNMVLLCGIDGEQEASKKVSGILWNPDKSKNKTLLSLAEALSLAFAQGCGTDSRDGINPMIVKYSLYYEHKEFLLQMLKAVNDSSGRQQVIRYRGTVTFEQYKDMQFTIRIKNKELDISIFRERQREESATSFADETDAVQERVLSVIDDMDESERS